MLPFSTFMLCLKDSIMEGGGKTTTGNLGICYERAHFVLTSIPGLKVLMGENGVCFLSPHKTPADGSPLLPCSYEIGWLTLC